MMDKKTFIEEIKKLKPCREGILFCEACNDYEEIVSKSPERYFVWAIINGYEDFKTRLEPNMTFEYGISILELLCHDTSLEKYCNMSKISPYWWAEIISKLPEYSEQCDWNNFTNADLFFIEKHQPQFKERVKEFYVR